MSEPSNYVVDAEAWNHVEGDLETSYAKCGRCKGSGIDPDCAKSRQDDEWDCVQCEGYGDIELRD